MFRLHVLGVRAQPVTKGRDELLEFFNLQGVGQYAYNSVQQLDVPPVMVITMFGAFFVVILSAMVDIIYAVLDPRIRLSA